MTNEIINLEMFEGSRGSWISSRKIAELFKKDHLVVLRNIENAMNSSPVDFRLNNFIMSNYRDKKGITKIEYYLNEFSFLMIVMGFTGKQAIEFKIKIIELFEDARKIAGEKLWKQLQ
jgi:Rha family phage regulatory protein